MARLRTIIFLSLFLCFAISPLFAGSITNDSPAPVEVSGQTVSGVFASLTLQSGQTIMLRQPYLWIQHVPRGDLSQEINIKIVETDGTMGLIQSPGGRYNFVNRPVPVQPNPDDSMVSSGPDLQTGLASNNSNVTLLFTLTKRNGTSLQEEVLASQTLDIPPDTVEVKVETQDAPHGDEIINVIIVMPDGRQHLVQTTNATIEISPEFRQQPI